MKIHGFLKLTLLDYPGLVACTVFSGGCNFRCPFCHNATLVLDPDSNVKYEEDYILDYLKSRINKIQGVCFTGGEPLLENDIVDFMCKVKELGMKVKLDTNGFLFDKMKKTVESGCVDYVAMDIKNSPAKYGETIGLDNFKFDNIKSSVDYLIHSNIDYEFRTTIIDEYHEPDDFIDIAKLIKGCKHYYLQCFKDSGDIMIPGLHAPNNEKVIKICDILAKNEINPVLRNFNI